MVGKFWDTVASELAKKWASLAASAAAVFWALGVVAWGHAHENGFNRINEFLSRLDGFTQVVLAAGSVALLLGSAYLVTLLQPAVLRLLQGDISVDARLFKWKRGHVVTRRVELRDELSALQAKGLATLSAAESRRAARLDRKLHRLPIRPPDQRLTRLGNLMSASEARPLVRYGLNSGVVWPALWLVLPEFTRAELQAARGSLDSAVRALVWGVLLAVWTVWTPWALLAATLVTAVAFATLLRRAEAFGDLTEAAFALQRTELYTKLRFPLPTTPEEDRIVGEQVTQYLWRGSVPDGMHWRAPVD